MPTIAQVQGGDRSFSQFQQNVQTAVKQVLANPLMQGLVLTSVKLLPGLDNTIAHTLNRTLQGWFIVRQRAQAQIWDNQDANTSQDKTLVLRSSDNVTVDIWVY